MSKKKWAVMATCVLACLVAVPSFAADDEEKPKYTIKDVMAKGLKPKQLKDKVVAGDASDKEKKLLHEMFVALAKAKPEKGDAKSWKTKTEALVAAAKAVVEGKDDGIAKLKKASNCKACHSVHKP